MRLAALAIGGVLLCLQQAEPMTCRPPGMVWIPGGAFEMGSNTGYLEESPRVPRTVAPFWIDTHEVTNAQFAAFVAATHYKTDAERTFGTQAGGGMVFKEPTDSSGATVEWWHLTPGADWRHPEGPGSTIEGRGDYPVVQVTYRDAEAYARWLGHSLPSEAQWEFAALGGEDPHLAPLTVSTHSKTPSANSWQGFFPFVDTGEDGFKGLAPVGQFAANGYGLYDMLGNVWELTRDPYRDGHSVTPADLIASVTPTHVIKGGSYLCATNYCGRDHASSRQPQDDTLGSMHVGFRTIMEAADAGEACR